MAVDFDLMRREFERSWPWLQAAIETIGQQTHTKDHIWQRLETGRAQLWPLPNSAIVTEIVTYDNDVRHLRGWLAGGDLDEIRSLMPSLEEFGRRNGCSKAIIEGRKGWTRALAAQGYDAKTVNLTKDL